MAANQESNPEPRALHKLLRGLLQDADQPLFVSFIILTLSTVGVALIGLLLIASTSIHVISIQRLANQLITLAAITLIGAITCSFFVKSQAKVWVLALGFLSIGALIVPTNDLIRIVLAAARTDTDFQSLYPAHDATSHGRKEAAQDRAQALYREIADMRRNGACEDSAVEVIDNILRNSDQDEPANAHDLYDAVTQVQATDACASDTVATIVRFLTDEDEKEMLHIVQDRGLMDVLAAIGAANERPVLLFDNVGNERFRADLEFLRAEGLIRFLYNDWNTIRLTPVGRRVTARAGVDVTTTSSALATYSTAPEANSLVLTDGFYTRTHIIGPGDNVYEWNVPSSAYYTLDIIALGGIDPVLQLYSGMDNGDARQLVHENDDGGNGLNARLAVQLEQGRHFLVVSEYSGATGQVVVNIRQE